MRGWAFLVARASVRRRPDCVVGQPGGDSARSRPRSRWGRAARGQKAAGGCCYCSGGRAAGGAGAGPWHARRLAGCHLPRPPWPPGGPGPARRRRPASAGGCRRPPPPRPPRPTASTAPAGPPSGSGSPGAPPLGPAEHGDRTAGATAGSKADRRPTLAAAPSPGGWCRWCTCSGAAGRRGPLRMLGQQGAVPSNPGPGRTGAPVLRRPVPTAALRWRCRAAGSWACRVDRMILVRRFTTVLWAGRRRRR